MLSLRYLSETPDHLARCKDLPINLDFGNLEIRNVAEIDLQAFKYRSKYEELNF